MSTPVTFPFESRVIPSFDPDDDVSEWLLEFSEDELFSEPLDESFAGDSVFPTGETGLLVCVPIPFVFDIALLQRGRNEGKRVRVN